MKYLNKYSGRLLFSILGLMLFIQGCDSDNPDSSQGMPAPAVSVIEIPSQPVGTYLESVARTEAKDKVDLIARVEGILKKRSFDEGKPVQKDQELFVIDKAPFEAALNKANANLASSVAGLHKASADLTRGREMFQKNFISQADMDTLINQKKQAESSVAANRASVREAEIDLSYTEIRAPFSGIIGRANYSVGSLVSLTSGSLATLTSLHPIYVYFQVNEKEIISYLKNKQSLRLYTSNQMVTLNEKTDAKKIDIENDENIDTEGENTDDTKNELSDDAQNTIASSITIKLQLPDGSIFSELGRLDFSDTHIDESTGTLSIRAVFPNKDSILLPGMYVTLIAESNDKVDKPIIPQSAVQENQKGRFVLVLDNTNTVVVKVVKLGRRIGPMWVVENGLKVGEQIIVEGLQKLKPGTKVNPILKQINLKTGTLSEETNSEPPVSGSNINNKNEAGQNL